VRGNPRTAVIPLLLAGLVCGPLAVGAAPPARAEQSCVTTPDANATDLWALRRLQPERAWPLTTGAGVTVAVIDSGVDARVPALAGRVQQGPDILDGGAFPSTRDCSGHGTLVAGIIAAAPVTGSGFHGVAPGVTILSIRQNEQLPGSDARGNPDGMATAIRYAVDQHVGVINISATTTADSAPLREAVAYALAANIVVVAAAGNDDLGLSQDQAPKTYYPAAYPGVLAVAGTDEADQRTSTSHVADYVGIAAPGKDVVSTGPNGPGRYAVVTGTSFATPFVAGVAALVRAYHPRLTVKQVVARLEATADQPPSAGAGTGAGVVDPYFAVTAVLPGESGVAPAAATPTRAGALPARAVAPAPVGASQAAIGALVGFGVVAAALGLLFCLPRGRARRWRPGRRRVSA
jgi:membrane-anchored mycosin MYCP